MSIQQTKTIGDTIQRWTLFSKQEIEEGWSRLHAARDWAFSQGRKDVITMYCPRKNDALALSALFLRRYPSPNCISYKNDLLSFYCGEAQGWLKLLADTHWIITQYMRGELPLPNDPRGPLFAPDETIEEVDKRIERDIRNYMGMGEFCG